MNKIDYNYRLQIQNSRSLLNKNEGKTKWYQNGLCNFHCFSFVFFL